MLSGTVNINGQQVAQEARTVLFERDGGGLAIEASTDAKLLLLSGEPIDQPVVARGPFVMNTTEEIKKAVQDVREGRFGSIHAA